MAADFNAAAQRPTFFSPVCTVTADAIHFHNMQLQSTSMDNGRDYDMATPAHDVRVCHSQKLSLTTLTPNWQPRVNLKTKQRKGREARSSSQQPAATTSTGEADTLQ